MSYNASVTKAVRYALGMNTEKVKKKRVYAGRSHASRASERRSAFITAALDIIGTKGYAGATVRALCKQAGFTDRYFYEIFGNTENLLLTLHDQVAGELVGSLTGAISAADPDSSKRVIATTAAFYRFIRDERKARILMIETVGISENITAHTFRTNVKIGSVFASVAPDIVDENIAGEDAFLREGSEEVILFGLGLVGIISMPAAAWIMGTKEMAEADMIRMASSMIIGAIQNFRTDRYDTRK